MLDTKKKKKLCYFFSITYILTLKVNGVMILRSRQQSS